MFLSRNISLNVFDCPLKLNRGRKRLIFYCAVSLVIILAIPTLIDLHNLWRTDENFRGLALVPIIACLIVLKRRKEFVGIGIIPSVPICLAGIITAGFMLLAYGAGDVRLAVLSFIATLGLLCFGALGKKGIKVIFGPLVFLALMIPPYESIVDLLTLGLQHFHSTIQDYLLPFVSNNYAGRDSFALRFEGLDHPLIISPECSGIRSLLGMCIVASIFVMLKRLNFWATLVVVFAAGNLAIIFNFVRITVIMQLQLLGYHAYTFEPWHGLLGALVFVMEIILLHALSIYLSKHLQKGMKKESIKMDKPARRTAAKF